MSEENKHNIGTSFIGRSKRTIKPVKRFVEDHDIDEDDITMIEVDTPRNYGKPGKDEKNAGDVFNTPKRGRGRPKKLENIDQKDKYDTKCMTETPKKRGRGRPKKNEHEDEVLDEKSAVRKRDDSESELVSEDEELVSESALKRLKVDSFIEKETVLVQEPAIVIEKETVPDMKDSQHKASVRVIKTSMKDKSTQSDKDPLDADHVQDLLWRLPPSDQNTLVSNVMRSMSVKDQESLLSEVFMQILADKDEKLVKLVPKDYMQVLLNTAEMCHRQQMDNLTYYLSKALDVGLISPESPSWALIQVVIMSLFGTQPLEDFFSKPHAAAFSDWLQTGSYLALSFLPHMNQILFPLTNMQFSLVPDGDAAGAGAIMLEILATASGAEAASQVIEAEELEDEEIAAAAGEDLVTPKTEGEPKVYANMPQDEESIHVIFTPGDQSQSSLDASMSDGGENLAADDIPLADGIEPFHDDDENEEQDVKPNIAQLSVNAIGSHDQFSAGGDENDENSLSPNASANVSYSAGAEVSTEGAITMTFDPGAAFSMSPDKQGRRRRRTQKGEVPTNDEGKSFCAECNITFRENRNYFKHMKLHDGRKSHACSFCEARFDLRRTHLHHILTSHCLRKKDDPTSEYTHDVDDTRVGSGNYECCFCGKHRATHPEEPAFKAHVRHHLNDRLPCEYCDKLFWKEDMLQKHVAVQHSGPPYNCYKCKIQFHDLRKFRQHMADEQKPKIECRACAATFDNRKDFHDHIQNHTPEELVEAGIKSIVVADKIKEVEEKQKKEKRMRRRESVQKQRELNKLHLQQLTMSRVVVEDESGQTTQLLVPGTEASGTGNAVLVAPASGGEQDAVAAILQSGAPAMMVAQNTKRGVKLKPFQCQLCDRAFTKAATLETHVRRTHTGDEVRFSCRFCTETFAMARLAKKHELTVHCLQPDGQYRCMWCHKLYSNPTKLRSHEWLHTKEAIYQCRYCDHRCKSQSILTRHEQSHLGIKPFLCGTCGKGFSMGSALKTHQRLHTGELPYACSECQERFNTKTQLKMHEDRVHNGGAKGYLCNICGKGFTTKESARVHTRIHTGERPFSCSYCEKAFTNKMAMKRHEIMLHGQGDGTHTCEYCNKTFSYKYSLYYHRKLVHETKATLKCKYCPKLFRRKQEVMTHELVHTGHKNYKCLYCSKRFRTASQVSEHKVIHEGAVRFRCPECDKGFVHRSSYKRHVLLHRGVTPFSCPFCSKAFPDRSNMLSHVKHVHKDECPDPRELSIPSYRFPPTKLPHALRRRNQDSRPIAQVGDGAGTVEDQVLSYMAAGQEEGTVTIEVIQRGAGDNDTGDDLAATATLLTPSDDAANSHVLQNLLTGNHAGATANMVTSGQVPDDDDDSVAVVGDPADLTHILTSAGVTLRLGSVGDGIHLEHQQQGLEAEVIEAGHHGNDDDNDDDGEGTNFIHTATTQQESSSSTLNLLVEDALGHTQMLCVPAGVQYVQVGDQIMEIGAPAPTSDME